MEYNINGEVDRYYNLDEILGLDIPSHIAAEIKEKFNKKVLCDCNGNCKIGKLCGLEVNHKLSMLYYIIEIDGDKIFVPTWKNLTKV